MREAKDYRVWHEAFVDSAARDLAHLEAPPKTQFALDSIALRLIKIQQRSSFYPDDIITIRRIIDIKPKNILFW